MDNSLENQQLTLIKEAISISITQLDYLGENINKIQELQKLREQIQEMISVNLNIDNNEIIKNIKNDFYINGTESIPHMGLKLLFNQTCELVNKESVCDAILWLNNPASFEGIEDLNCYSENKTKEEDPSLVLVKISKQQLHYFSLVDMYHIWVLCDLSNKIKRKQTDYSEFIGKLYSKDINEFQRDIIQDLEYITNNIQGLETILESLSKEGN